MQFQKNFRKILFTLLLALSAGSLTVPLSTAQAQSATQETTTYTVQRGDTLSRIARRFDTTVAVIRDANGIANTDRIYVGQELLVPPRDWPGHAPIDPDAVTPAPQYDGAERVQFAPGETRQTLRNSVVEGELYAYVLRARAGQEMFVTLASEEDNAIFIVRTPLGETLVGFDEKATSFVGTLPATGDYVVAVRGTVGSVSASYTLDIDILSADDEQDATTGTTYTVQRGDTLSRIARRFDTTVAAIRDANGIANADRIFVGQVLTIPGTDSSGETPEHGEVLPELVSVPDDAQRIQFASGATRQAVEGAVAEGERDSYLLRAQAYQEIYVTLVADDENANFTLVDPNGNLLTNRTTCCVLVGTLPASGDYLITVRSTGGEADYTLDVDVLPAESRANERIIDATTVTGDASATRNRTVAQGVEDRFSLRAEAGQRVNVTLSSENPNAGFTLIARDGSTLTRPNERVTDFSGTLSTSGEYFITITSSDGAAAYSLVVEILSTDEDDSDDSSVRENAERIQFAAGTSSATVSKQIAGGERDPYVLRASEGQQMNVTVTSEELITGFMLTDPNGNTLTRPDVAATEWIGTLPATGDYLITVVGSGSDTYTLEVAVQ